MSFLGMTSATAKPELGEPQAELWDVGSNLKRSAHITDPVPLRANVVWRGHLGHWVKPRVRWPLKSSVATVCRRSCPPLSLVTRIAERSTVIGALSSWHNSIMSLKKMNWRFDALMCDQHDYECILHGLSEIDRRYSCIAQYRDSDGELRIRGYLVHRERVTRYQLMRYLPQVDWIYTRGCSLMNSEIVSSGSITFEQFGELPKLGAPIGRLCDVI